MPIYEYQCSKCSEVFEAFQKITDDPLTECRFCQGQVEKLISQSSFQLKGTGWYLTDYANKSSSNSVSDKPKAEKETTKAKDQQNQRQEQKVVPHIPTEQGRQKEESHERLLFFVPAKHRDSITPLKVGSLYGILVFNTDNLGLNIGMYGTCMHSCSLKIPTKKQFCPSYCNALDWPSPFPTI